MIFRPKSAESAADAMIGREPFISNRDLMAAINAVQNAKNVSELLAAFSRHVQRSASSYHHIPAIGASNYETSSRYLAYNLPPEIAHYYETRTPKNDIAIRHLFSRAQTMWLSDLPKAETIRGSLYEQKVVKWTLALMGDALFVPLFGPFHRRGFAIICFGKSKDFYDDVFQWQMQALLQAIHIRYCHLVEDLKATKRLTNREGEVLELITLGKTNPEIAKILGISPSTVSGYVKQIFLKLDTQDRVTAALRASSSSLVS